MNSKGTISCQKYDEYELACVQQWHVELELANNRRISGQTINLETRADKSEYLILRIKKDIQAIDLNTIINIKFLHKKTN